MAYPGLVGGGGGGFQIGPTQSHRRLGEEAEADGRCQAAGGGGGGGSNAWPPFNPWSCGQSIDSLYRQSHEGPGVWTTTHAPGYASAAVHSVNYSGLLRLK